MLPRVRRLLKYFLLLVVLFLFSNLALRYQGVLEEKMTSSLSPKEVASALLAEKGYDILSISLLQSLWAGYGQIFHITAIKRRITEPLATLPEFARVKVLEQHAADTEKLHKSNLTSGGVQSLILKLITPPPTRAGDEGHARKILSYQVEQYFYSHLAIQLPASVSVAQCLASINQHHEDGTSTTAIVLNDLAQNFPVAGEKRGSLSSTQVKAAVDWLSGFHGFWWPRVQRFNRTELVLPPLEEIKHDGQNTSEKTVWLNGGYTYLATRQKEYEALKHDHDSEWSKALTELSGGESRSVAEAVAAFLAPSTTGQSPIEGYQTLIHGDVKSENLFTSESGKEVAFYDFQYTGLGLGVCDLAKLFTCSVPLSMLVASKDISNVLLMQKGERELLERYWNRVREISMKDYDWETFVGHWEVALVDWLRFQASWGFWGNTNWLEARVRSILMDKKWRKSLGRMAAMA